MLSARTRRATALGTTTVAALLVAGAAALPAQADPLKVTLNGPSVFVVDPTTTSFLNVNLNSVGPGTAQNTKLMVDTTGLAGLATFQPNSGPDCTGSGPVFTCAVHNTPGGAINFGESLKFDAVAGAKLGTTGKLHLGLSADNGGSAALDVAVTLGGAKLSVADIPVQKNVLPGAVYSPTIKITNNGQLAGNRTVVLLMPTDGLDFTQKFANCEYGTLRPGNPQSSVSTLARCTVNTSIPAGRSATLDPVRFNVTNSALYPDLDVFVSPDKAELQWLDGQYDFTQGSGQRLTLGSPETPNPAPDTIYNEGGAPDLIAQLTVVNHADFAATADWSPVDGGKSGTLSVGMHNFGPAGVNYRSGDDPADVEVVLSPGTTVGHVPDGCLPKQKETPNDYLCRTQPWIRNGYQATFAFGLTNTDPSLTAKVSLAGDNNLPLPFDPNPANNAVTVALGAQPSGTPTGTPSAAPSATPTTAQAAATGEPREDSTDEPREDSTDPAVTRSGDDGKGLAFTGGGSDAAPLAAIGGAAVVLGAGALFFANRRRKAGNRA